MRTFVILYFSSFAFLCTEQTSSNALQCTRPNESLKCVRDCPPERSCNNKDIKFSCLQVNKRCQLKCVCKDYFYRSLNGDCVSAEICERCPGPNEYYSCGSACDNVCAELDTQNQTHCPILNIRCNDSCYCRENYARNENNICVPINECIPPATSNEELQTCKQTCPPDLCFSLVARFKCQSDPPCEPGFRCKAGYLRKSQNESCIPICQCPELANSPDCN